MSIRRKTTSCCPSVLRAPVRRDHAEELATAFKAIADPGRLRLLSFIAAQPEAEACVCHLVEPLGLSQPTVSHHLRVLGSRPRARALRAWMFYRLILTRSRTCDPPRPAGRQGADEAPA
jgi:ArsR family transcriptional regulator